MKRAPDPNARLRKTMLRKLAKGCTDRTLFAWHGKGKCRFCAGDVPKGRRTFCSSACVHEYSIRSDPGYARHQVHKRDAGRCESCGLDTERLERIVHRLATRRAEALVGHAPDRRRGLPRASHAAIVEARRRVFGLLRRPLELGHLWEADHRVPVAEGGGCCGLEGLRTLCIWCHKLETRRLARRLARARTPQATLFGEAVLDADIAPKEPKRRAGSWALWRPAPPSPQRSLFDGEDD